MATRCEASGTLCDNSGYCSSGCPTGVYGTSLCDGTYTGTRVDLRFEGLSGTIPPQLGDISQLKKLYLKGNSISGTIPPEMSELSQLETLDLEHNSLTGTIPSQLGGIGPLENLDLSDNSISGTIPAQLGDNSQLEFLSLGTNPISGTLPSQLGDISGLSELSLSNSRLAYSNARVEYICRGAGSATCLGVPPDSCSAFADAQQLVTDPNECVVCDDQTAGVVLVGVCALVGIIALAAFVRFVVRHPATLKRWVSTAAILINHAQTASIIASMRLEWPRSLVAIASALKLNLLMLPSAGCFVGGEDASSFDTYAVSTSSVMLLLLLAPILVRHVALCRRRLDIADTAELVLSLIYSLLFTFGWSLVLDYLAYAADGYFDLLGVVALGRYPYKAYLYALFTVPLLGALLLILLIRFFGNVLAFKRGVNSGLWRRPANPCFACRSSERSESFGRPIPPRRLERQVAYLVGRFARHAPRWQIVIWLRQLLLLLVVFTSDVVFVTTENFDAGRYAIAAVAIAVTLVFWRLHRRALPFAFRFQNALESCLYGATALFLALAMVYTALPADPVALRVTVEALMATVLLGSLIVGAVYSIRELRRMRRAIVSVDLSAILSAADSKIDGSLADRLRDGSVRLLRCSWLASPASDAFLGRDASGAVIMKRRQDLPTEAFVPCDEAVAMLKRGDRSILALSHGWLTAHHPDPHGTTLAAVRRYLEADAAASSTGLFWDFVSLPQKGPNGEARSVEDAAMFRSVMDEGIMGNFYASVTGTSVIQQREIVLPPSADTGVGAYNSRPYEGEGGRGWCIFEQGTAMTVLAHLTAAERQAREGGKALPERFRRAQASRAKVYDIGGEAPVARECSLPPEEVLDEACRAIENARFTGKADQVMVPQMLAEFEWTFRSTFEEALGDHATSGATIGRKEQEAISREATQQRRRQQDDDTQDTDGTERV